MTHLTHSELLAWRDQAQPSPAARDKVVGHLAACDECAAVYAELMRTREPEAAAPHFDRQPFASRAYAAIDARPGRVLVFQRKLFIPIAAAAAIVLALWLPSTRPAGDTPIDTGAVVRGSRPEIVAPSGDTAGLIEFRWASPISAARYAVEVKDQTGQRVFYRETRDERLIADAALQALLRPGVRFTWTVTALDAEGEAISQSLPREFTVAVPR